MSPPAQPATTSLQPSADAAAPAPSPPGRGGVTASGDDVITRTRGILTQFKAHPVTTATLLASALLGVVIVAVATGAGTTLGEHLTQSADSSPDSSPAARGLTAVAQMVVPSPGEYALPVSMSVADTTDLVDSGFRGLDTFVRRHAGAAVGQATVTLVLNGPSSGSVTVNGIKAYRFPTSPVLSGTVIHLPSQGDKSALPLALDLDRPGGQLRDADGMVHFPRRTIPLGPNEQQSIDLTVAGTKEMSCWVFVVTFVSTDGTRGTLVIDADGASGRAPQNVPVASRFCLTGPAANYGASFSASLPDGAIRPDADTSATPAP